MRKAPGNGFSLPMRDGNLVIDDLGVERDTF